MKSSWGPSTRCREMSTSEEHWCGPVVFRCWMMIDIHGAQLLFYHNKGGIYTTQAKAVLTLHSLTHTEELVAETAHWEQLNAAWGSTVSVRLFAARMLVKAASGRAWLWLTKCASSTSRTRSSFPTEPGRLHMPGERVPPCSRSHPGRAKEHGEVTYCPTMTGGTKRTFSTAAMRLRAGWPRIYSQRKRGSTWVSQMGAYQGRWRSEYEKRGK